jgi:cytidine deaminase
LSLSVLPAAATFSSRMATSHSNIDWEALRSAAVDARAAAYAPYSGFPVGAAALVDDGRLVAGCNVESASYGLSLCAECGLVSNLALSGGGKLLAFVCVDVDGRPLAPCGRCRQLLFEHAADGMLLEMPSGLKTIDQVLPEAFGPSNLRVRG